MLRNRLKYWRHQKMMNQTEFATFLEVNLSLYNQWELNRKQPSKESLYHISKKLNVSMNDLLEEK
jgi:transcriptional regulator with XRE-family HTH domain